MNNNGPTQRHRAGLIGFGLLLAALAGHLAWDIHERDAFSWMDPVQYYQAASAIAKGGSLSGFVVATLYPVLLGAILALHDSIPVALGVHALWLIALGAGWWFICRRMELGFWAAPGLLALLAGPAMFGLSRELYLEFPLTALAVASYAVWLRRGDTASPHHAIYLGLLMASGFALKMTFPVFLAGPIALEAFDALRRRDGIAFQQTVMTLLLPIGSVMALLYLFFPGMFQYYLSIGNTEIAPMRLIGPPETMSWAAAGFYPWQIVRNYIGWLGLYLLPLLALTWPFRRGGVDRQRLELWLWALVPIAVFTWMPVREVRHLAPAVPPLFLLAGLALRDRIPTPRRTLLSAATLLLALAAYALVATRIVPAPYLLTKPLQHEKIFATLFSFSPDRDRFWSVAGGPPNLDQWKFTQSIAIQGFEPNEALAFAWAMATGTTLDLDQCRRPRETQRPEGYAEFIDFFLLSSFNLYNRRAGWPGVYETLPYEQALACANAVVVALAPGESSPVFAGFTETARLERRHGGAYIVYRPDQPPAASYRRRYIETYLARQPQPAPDEWNAIWMELKLDTFLRAGHLREETWRDLFPPDFALRGPIKSVYFLNVYKQLLAALPDAAGRRPITTTAP